MAKNQLVYNGITYEAIWNCNVILEDNLPLDALPIDTMTAEIEDPRLEDRLWARDGLLVTASGLPFYLRPLRYGLKRYTYGEIVQLYHDGVLIGKFYLESIVRKETCRWLVSCISPIGLLENDNHWGGIYSNVKASTIIADIIHGIIPYTLETALGNMVVYGWLPKGTRRDNLRQVLLAIGGRVRKNASGDVSIEAYKEQQAYGIEPTSFYLSGNTSTDGTPASEVVVTEHSFFQSDADETVTLFDGVALAGQLITPAGKTMEGAMIEFSDPCYALTASGTSILESGVNYAIITGSSAALLTGKKYAHSQRIITRTNPAAQKPSIKTLENCYLVNFTNSEGVADRLMAYYGSKREVQADIVMTNQKPGDVVSFIDKYGDPTQGYIERLTVKMSNTLKATATFVSDFVPPGNLLHYTRRQVLTGSGTWTVPADCVAIRFVLFGGAFGGHAGAAGTAAGESQSYSASQTGFLSGKTTNFQFYLWKDGGKGGAGGAGGGASRIYEGRIDVSPGQQIRYACGSGSAGATYTGTDTAAAEGGATTFGTYSSASGQLPAVTGWVDVMTGEIFAKPGAAGLPGGNSGMFPENYTIPNGAYRPADILHFTESTGAQDESGRIWAGGQTPTNGTPGIMYWNAEDTDYAKQWQPNNDFYIEAYSGYSLGVGGAAGATAPAPQRNPVAGAGAATAVNGQNGLTPTLVPAKAGLTMGGRGGYGGGGGAPAGWCGGAIMGSYGNNRLSLTPGKPGSGGNGGRGGAGGDGMIIVYY